MSRLIQVVEALMPQEGDSAQFVCGYFTARQEALSLIRQHEAQGVDEDELAQFLEVNNICFNEKAEHAARLLADYLRTQPAPQPSGEVLEQRDRYIVRYLEECDAHMETKGNLIRAHNELDAALAAMKGGV